MSEKIQPGTCIRIYVLLKFSLFLFILIFAAAIFGINKNSVVHLNRKPTDKEAFEMAKVFIKDKLKQPNNAVFSATAAINKKNADNNYLIDGTMKTEDMSGKMILKNWTIKMHYTGGDWSDKSSWQISSVNIQR